MRKLFSFPIVLALAVGSTASSFAFFQARDSNYNVAISAAAIPSYALVGTTTNNTGTLTISQALTLPGTAPQLFVVALTVQTGTATWSSVSIAGTELTQILNPGNGTAIFAGVVSAAESQTVTATASGVLRNGFPLPFLQRLHVADLYWSAVAAGGVND